MSSRSSSQLLVFFSIVNWIFFFVFSHIRRSPSLPFIEAGRRMKRRSWKMWILPGFFLTRDFLPSRIMRMWMDSRGRHSFPHLWCQRRWWRHIPLTPLCIQFTPTQGRIKYQILFLQIKFVSWQICFEFVLNLFSFTFSRPTTDGSENGVDWVYFVF